MRKLTADLVQETTNTVGTGTLSLVQAAGWVRFADRFAAGDLVEYSIQDGDNWEVGQGTFGIGNTLARSKVRFTLTNGTSVVNPGAPLALSGVAAVVRAVISEELFSTLLKAEYAIKAANFTAADGFAYGIAGNNVQATLPSGQAGDRIRFFQSVATVTGFTVDPGVDSINNAAGVMSVDLPEFAFGLVYIAGYGWRIEA